MTEYIFTELYSLEKIGEIKEPRIIRDFFTGKIELICHGKISEISFDFEKNANLAIKFIECTKPFGEYYSTDRLVSLVSVNDPRLYLFTENCFAKNPLLNTKVRDTIFLMDKFSEISERGLDEMVEVGIFEKDKILFYQSPNKNYSSMFMNDYRLIYHQYTSDRLAYLLEKCRFANVMDKELYIRDIVTGNYYYWNNSLMTAISVPKENVIKKENIQNGLVTDYDGKSIANKSITVRFHNKTIVRDESHKALCLKDNSFVNYHDNSCNWEDSLSDKHMVQILILYDFDEKYWVTKNDFILVEKRPEIQKYPNCIDNVLVIDSREGLRDSLSEKMEDGEARNKNCFFLEEKGSIYFCESDNNLRFYPDKPIDSTEIKYCNIYNIKTRNRDNRDGIFQDVVSGNSFMQTSVYGCLVLIPLEYIPTDLIRYHEKKTGLQRCLLISRVGTSIRGTKLFLQI